MVLFKFITRGYDVKGLGIVIAENEEKAKSIFIEGLKSRRLDVNDSDHEIIEIETIDLSTGKFISYDDGCR